jgi:hypothetical protein
MTITNPEVLKTNIISIVMGALSMTIALMFNDLFTSILAPYNTSNIVVKTNLIVVVFGITMYIALYLNSVV